MVRSLLVAAFAVVASPLLLLAEGPPLPEGITSFGAAAIGDQLYLYGGHTGPAHTYSTADQSGELLTLDLKEDSAWKELEGGPKLQGLALVAHGDTLYRLGGFTAKNAEGEDHDLHSQAGVAAYDPETNRWEELTPMPEPRSSFDATVLGDRVYIAGGWSMQGEAGGQWHNKIWSADLTKRPLKWEREADAPFQRRAFALAAHQGKVYLIGGMTPEGTTRRVDVYDPATEKWTAGPELIGERSIDGFGADAVATEDGLFVSSLSGVVQRLEEDGSRWTTVAQLEAPRFFHVMIPAHEGLMLVGGANMSDGKLLESEVVPLPQPATVGQ